MEAATNVVFISDHNPLVWIREQRDPRGKFSRWLLELESLNYRVEYRRGYDNCAADYLSRSAREFDTNVNDDVEHFERHLYTISSGEEEWAQRVRVEQANDAVISDAIRQLGDKGFVGKGQLKRYSSLMLREGLLCHEGAVVVPRSLREEILKLVHGQCHAGVHRTYQMLKPRFLWRGMIKDTKIFCGRCFVCLKNKRSTIPKQPLNPIQEYQYPRAMVSFDIATLPWAANGFRYVLIIVDLFAKFVEAVPLKSQDAKSIAKAFMDGWVLRHGYPLVLLSDQGRNVDGAIVRGVCEKLGIEKRRSSAYHPEGDGQAERTVQTFKQQMRCMLEERKIEKTDWPSLVNEVTFQCNAMVNSSTGYSPNEVMFGLELRSGLDLLVQ